MTELDAFLRLERDKKTERGVQQREAGLWKRALLNVRCILPDDAIDVEREVELLRQEDSDSGKQSFVKSSCREGCLRWRVLGR